MAITRRQFLTRTGLATAASFLPYGWLRNPLLRQALAQSIGDRYLVVLYLGGGNDGLNTVTPIDNGSIANLRTAYEAARFAGGLRLLANELTPFSIGLDPNTDTPLALHPGLAGLKNLYDLGKVAVIQGCGYPQPNLSHEESTLKWETGMPVGTLPATGWLGRYLASNYDALAIPALTADSQIAGEFQQTVTSVLGIDSLRDFDFPYDDYDDSDNAAKDACFSALFGSAQASLQSTFSRIGAVGSAALSAAHMYPQVYSRYVADRASWNAQYNSSSTSTKRALRDIAACIYGCANGMVENRFFQLSNGGYDTHGDQGTTGENDWHRELHAEVGDAIELFYHDLVDMGLHTKVTLMIWSEFSRRIFQNDSNGTDHGSQGPMFVIGGSVQGGVYGNHPNIAEEALDDDGNSLYSQAAGDPHRSTDFRDVYGTILKHWLGVSNPSLYLPLDSASLDPTIYWRSANFDLGFLS